MAYTTDKLEKVASISFESARAIIMDIVSIEDSIARDDRISYYASRLNVSKEVLRNDAILMEFYLESFLNQNQYIAQL